MLAVPPPLTSMPPLGASAPSDRQLHVPDPAAPKQAPASHCLAGHTVYLGGSFDPAHWGHVTCGWALLMQDAEELWLAPTATHADKKNQCAYALRLQQCRLVAQEIDRRLPEALRGRIKVSDVENQVASGGQTVRIFEHLTQRWPQRSFALALGSDCLAKAPSWDGWERLQQLARVVVLDRPGYAGSHRNMLAEAMPAISSTDIRGRLAAGRSVEALMPPSVERLVREQRLYGADGAEAAHGVAGLTQNAGSTTAMDRADRMAPASLAGRAAPSLVAGPAISPPQGGQAPPPGHADTTSPPFAGGPSVPPLPAEFARASATEP